MRFAPDHPIAALRGRRILRPTAVRKALRKRIAWLSDKVAWRGERDGGVRASPMLDELKAMVQLAEPLAALPEEETDDEPQC